jgi:hypothetical protein
LNVPLSESIEALVIHTSLGNPTSKGYARRMSFPGHGFLPSAWLKRPPSMSATGTKQTSIPTLNMSAFGGRADISDRLADVR